MSKTKGKGVIQQRGEAVGKLNGFSHVVLICGDMDRSVRFYRDLLGLRLVKTTGARRGYQHLYHFELSGGELFSLYEMKAVGEPVPPIVNGLWPGGEGSVPAAPEKLDHLAFNVDTAADVRWFHEYLQREGVEVSEIHGEPAGTGFFPARFHFWDPDGNPIEVATMDVADPGWQGFDPMDWYEDQQPVRSLSE